MTSAGGLQQQRRLFPLAVLRSNFNPDLRFCLLCTVVRLRQCVGFFAYSIVAASPIEWFPSQRKSGHTDIRRKDLHVLHTHVANRETKVRYVFGLRNAAVVVGLFFLEMSLADLRPILGRLLPRFLQTQSDLVLLRNEINPKGSYNIPRQELIQVLVLCGKSVLRNRQVILGLGQTSIDLQRISFQYGLLCDVTQSNSLRLFQIPYSFPCCIHGSLRCYEFEIGTSHFGRDLLFLCANVFFRDLTPKFCRANSQSDLVLLCQRLIDAAIQKGSQSCRRVNPGIC